MDLVVTFFCHQSYCRDRVERYTAALFASTLILGILLAPSLSLSLCALCFISLFPRRVAGCADFCLRSFTVVLRQPCCIRGLNCIFCHSSEVKKKKKKLSLIISMLCFASPCPHLLSPDCWLCWLRWLVCGILYRSSTTTMLLIASLLCCALSPRRLAVLLSALSCVYVCVILCTPQFYENHMADWPELALVAEHVGRNNVSHLFCCCFTCDALFLFFF